MSQGLKSAFFVPVCVAWLPWGTGDAAWTVLVPHWDLLEFLLHIGV